MPNLLICDDGHGGLAIAIGPNTEWGAGPSLIPLRAGKVESTLHNVLIALHAGISQQRIAAHLLGECDTDLHCPCCKLEGRVLRGQGRKALSAEDRLRAQAHAAASGTVQVRHIAPKANRAEAQKTRFHDALRKAWAVGTTESLEDLL